MSALDDRFVAGDGSGDYEFFLCQLSRNMNAPCGQATWTQLTAGLSSGFSPSYVGLSRDGSRIAFLQHVGIGIGSHDDVSMLDISTVLPSPPAQAGLQPTKISDLDTRFKQPSAQAVAIDADGDRIAYSIWERSDGDRAIEIARCPTWNLGAVLDDFDFVFGPAPDLPPDPGPYHVIGQPYELIGTRDGRIFSEVPENVCITARYDDAQIAALGGTSELNLKPYVYNCQTLRTGKRVCEWIALQDVEYDEEDDVVVIHTNLTGVFALFLEEDMTSRDPLFQRGDVDGRGVVDLSDAVLHLEFLFLGIGDGTCEDAADTNDDGDADFTDDIHLLNVLFVGRGVIPDPGMDACGLDPTEDDLGCQASPSCDF
jgi:hypothetical protein